MKQFAPIIVPTSMEQMVKTEFYTLRTNLSVLAETNKTDVADASYTRHVEKIVSARQFPVCLLLWLRNEDELGPGEQANRDGLRVGY